MRCLPGSAASCCWQCCGASPRARGSTRPTGKSPSVIARNYLRVLMHPLCLGYILVNAAAFGALFAYVSGSSLFLINVVGLRPLQYGLVFAATSLGIMAGGFLNGRLSARRLLPAYPLTVGLVLAAVST